MTADDTPQLQASEREPQPKARTLFRQGAVYGLAGAMKAADVAMAAARGAVRGAREGVAVAEREPPAEGAAVAEREPAAEGVAVAEREPPPAA